MRATAIIPVKRFGVAKQRLLEALDRPGRAALVKAMLADVLAATASAELTERVIVVTGERRAERIALRSAAARHRAARGLPRSPGRRPLGGGDAGDRPRQGARGRAASPCCPGTVRCSTRRSSTRRSSACGADGWRSCPTATAPAPTRSCSRRRTRSARPSVPTSCARHADRARRAGHEVAVEPLDSLGLDVDTPDDLAALAEALERAPHRAPATAAELARLGRLRGGARA